jgi:peptidoglycan DL-endopeptidase RipB
MRHKGFGLIKLAWLTVMVTGHLIGWAGPAAADDGLWDPTLPMVPSAGAPGDPVAIANASLQATAQATQTTLELGRQFLGGLGINVGGNDTSGSRIPRVHGRQAVEYVIRRGASQLGVPYSWGGGTLNGPSRGVDSGANTVGFDCSGLTRFAFAGVGVLIPRFSGDQYNAGRHVPPSQAKRGDLIFYGPGGSQHVTLYLGNGQMLEASSDAGKVTVSRVRTAGMTPYVTRIIEY